MLGMCSLSLGSILSSQILTFKLDALKLGVNSVLMEMHGVLGSTLGTTSQH